MQPRPQPAPVFQSLSRRDKFLFVLVLAMYLLLPAAFIFRLLCERFFPSLYS
jgi:hypothetical protein